MVFIYFFLMLNLQNPVCVLHFEPTSALASHISSASGWRRNQERGGGRDELAKETEREQQRAQRGKSEQMSLSKEEKSTVL